MSVLGSVMYPVIVIPGPQRQRQGDLEFENSPGYQGDAISKKRGGEEERGVCVTVKCLC